MSVQEQWQEAYCIAERMYTENRPKKRTDLDMFSQIICSRYESIFSYDPYTDEYSFCNQELKYEEPVNPKCRSIAEADLEGLMKNTVTTLVDAPVYINITPIHVVPPSTVLVFNNSQRIVDGLNEALDNISSSLTKSPCESEVTPGAEYIFRHKNGKCYRCIILSESGDVNVTEGDRKYEVAFLDHCQIVNVKLKTLFIPTEFALANYPCALHCARLRGVAAFRSSYVSDYNYDVRAFYNDKAKRKAGLSALIYKTSKKEKKFIIDYPSLIGNPLTSAEEIIAVHGHLSNAVKDPVGLNYDKLIAMDVLVLEYPDLSDGEDGIDDDDDVNVENTETNEIDDDDDDVKLDLSDSEATIGSVPIQGKTSEALSFLPNSNDDNDCAFGKASITKFLLQQKADDPQVLHGKSMEPPQQLPSSPYQSQEIEQPQQHQNSKISDENVLDTTFNDTMSSFRSAAINQPRSSNPTPQPTFDEPTRGDLTPKKSIPNVDGGSPDGWGDDTPKKSPVQPSKSQTKWESNDEFGTQKPLRKLSTSVPIVNSEDPKPQKPSSPTPSRQSIQRPMSPIPQTNSELNLFPEKLSPVPLMSFKVNTPEKFKLDSNVSSLAHNQEQHTLPSIAPIIKSDTHTHVFGRPPASLDTKDHMTSTSSFDVPKENTERTPIGSPYKSDQHSQQKKHGSSVGGSVIKFGKQSDTEDQVFDITNQEENLTTMVHVQDNSSVIQDANISKASTNGLNQRLIDDAQNNFHDTDDEDGWGVSSQDKQNGKKEQVSTEKVSEQVVPIVPATSLAFSDNCVEDGEFSAKSVCSEDFGENEKSMPEVEYGADAFTTVIVDEFAQVSNTMKHLATSFVNAIRDAAVQKNHPIFMIEVLAFEVMLHKMPTELDKRFWRSKVAEAKVFESAFH